MAEISAKSTNISDKLIKRLNERYTQIARDFGVNSAITRYFKTKLEAVFGVDNMHLSTKLTKAGNPKRRKGKPRQPSAADLGLRLVDRNATTRNVSQEDLDALLSLRTSGEIKKTVKEQAKRESEYSQAMGGGPVSYEDVLSAMDYIYKLDQDDDNDLYEAYKMYWESVGGHKRPDYIIIADLAKAIKDQNNAIDSKNMDEVTRLDQYMHERLNAYNKFNAGTDLFGGI